MPKIIVDQEKLQQQTSMFLRSPYSQKVWAEFSPMYFLDVILSGFVVIVGIVQVITIRWAYTGLKSIWKGLSLQMLRDSLAQGPIKQEDLRPLICHSIIVGSTKGLVIGSFDPDVDHVQLAALSSKLADIYDQPSMPSGQHEIWYFMHDDVFQRYRRRTLPASYPGVANAILFDVDINMMDGTPSKCESIMYAFVATDARAKVIKQIPWGVANDCVETIP